VRTTIFPEDFAVEIPERNETDPPVFFAATPPLRVVTPPLLVSEVLVVPAANVTAPPAAEATPAVAEIPPAATPAPEPDVNDIRPEPPRVLPPAAVTKLRAPELPVLRLVVPVENDSPPDTPEEPEVLVLIFIFPLVLVVPAPELKDTAPPVNVLLVPPTKAIAPPTPAAP
jgi:hypothetical protein